MENAVMKNQGFAERFREACQDAGLTMTMPALGRTFGVSTTTIWNYLHGEKLPSMDSALDMAGKLNVCVEWLLTGRGRKRPNDGDFLDISSLPEAAKANLKAFVNSLANPPSTSSTLHDPRF